MYGSKRSLFVLKLIFLSRGTRLIGFPFTLGFFSKDIILGCASSLRGGLILIVFLFSCSFTISYRIRIIFLGLEKNFSFMTIVLSEENTNFILPVLILFSIMNPFFGTFFVFEFFQLQIFSLLDSSLGLFVLVLGGFLSLFNLKSFFFIFFYTMFFPPTNFLSKVNKIFPLWGELTWIEVTTGKGVLKLTRNIFFSLKNLFLVRMFPFLIFLLLIFSLV